MTRLRILLILLSLLPFEFSRGESQIYVPGGFYSGEQYMRMSEWQKKSVIAGIHTGMLLGNLAAGKNTIFIERLEGCTKGVSVEQLMAAFDKYLRDNPSKWDLSLSLAWAEMINRFCAARSYTLM